MSRLFQNETTAKIVRFLREIGITVEVGEVEEDSFLPGVAVAEGRLIVDEPKLLYPGDLLHEAGHLAVVPAAGRRKLSGKVESLEGKPHVIESAAMSWSYAACSHLGLDPRTVFHEHGYHGRSENLLLGFELGVFPGLHELVAAGMTVAGSSSDVQFPVMRKWLRD